MFASNNLRFMYIKVILYYYVPLFSDSVRMGHATLRSFPLHTVSLPQLDAVHVYMLRWLLPCSLL